MGKLKCILPMIVLNAIVFSVGHSDYTLVWHICGYDRLAFSPLKPAVASWPPCYLSFSLSACFWHSVELQETVCVPHSATQPTAWLLPACDCVSSPEQAGVADLEFETSGTMAHRNYCAVVPSLLNSRAQGEATCAAPDLLDQKSGDAFAARLVHGVLLSQRHRRSVVCALPACSTNSSCV